jgi:hypothetical protein
MDRPIPSNSRLIDAGLSATGSINEDLFFKVLAVSCGRNCLGEFKMFRIMEITYIFGSIQEIRMPPRYVCAIEMKLF